MAAILHIDQVAPLKEQLQRPVEFLRSGGVVAYPTETFYGLAVDALDPAAIRRIFAAKQRQESQPLLILIPHRSCLLRYVTAVPQAAETLMDRFWPGPLTLIFTAQPHLPPDLCAHTGTIAIRMSPHPVAQALVEAFGGAITSTSANLSGQPSAATAQEVKRQIGDVIDLIIDAGPTPGGKPSTLVDVTGSSLRLVREGAISSAILRACIPDSAVGS